MSWPLPSLDLLTSMKPITKTCQNGAILRKDRFWRCGGKKTETVHGVRRSERIVAQLIMIRNVLSSTLKALKLISRSTVHDLARCEGCLQRSKVEFWR